MTDNLTRIEVICLDKKVGDVQRAIAGLVVDVKSTPIANAAVRNGKVSATSNGELVTMFAKWLGKKKIKKVDANLTREFLTGIGQQPERYGYLLLKSKNYGLLKKIGKGKTSAYNVQGVK